MFPMATYPTNDPIKRTTVRVSDLDYEYLVRHLSAGTHNVFQTVVSALFHEFCEQCKAQNLPPYSASSSTPLRVLNILKNTYLTVNKPNLPHHITNDPK